MIDWLNALLGMTFLATGLMFVWVAFFKASSYKEGVAFSIVGLFAFAIVLYSPDWTVSFDPELHECTAWECSEGGFKIYNFRDVGNKTCIYPTSYHYWNWLQDGISIVLKTSVIEEAASCVSFREKTSEELEQDYCDKNPNDNEKCECVEREKIIKPNESAIQQGCKKYDTILLCFELNISAYNSVIIGEDVIFGLEDLSTLVVETEGSCIRAEPKVINDDCDGKEGIELLRCNSEKEAEYVRKRHGK